MDNPAGSVPVFPRLRLDVDLAFVGDSSVLVRGHSGSVVLRGAFVANALPALLSRLDGGSRHDALIGTVEPALRPEAAELLSILSQRGFLADGPASSDPMHNRLASWGLAGADAKAAQARLAAARIGVAGIGSVATALTRALIDGGVGECTRIDPAHTPEPDAGPTPTMIVLASDRMSLAGVDAVNRMSQQDGVPWLLVRIDRTTALIGPYVVPGQTACFTCYEQRARANADHPREHEALFQTWRQIRDGAGPSPIPPEYAAILGNWVALDLMRAIALGRNAAAAGRIISLDLQSLTSASREILRLPRCPDCSRQRTWPLTRIWDIPKAAPTEGGDAAANPV